MFRNVQRRVRATIRQEPYLGFNALGDVYLAGLVPEPPKVTLPPPAPARLSEAAEAWTVTKDSKSVASLEAFIRRFGDTYYGDLAKERLDDLKQAEAIAAEKKKAEADARAKADVGIKQPQVLEKKVDRKGPEAEGKKIATGARQQCLARCESLPSWLNKRDSKYRDRQDCQAGCPAR